ncbi:SusC/RagA family TonB-linked outer membrane protein [Confluentibacter sediminis]|uniref:SusC/RagA family TonB-linked outer membrane protein n=1 Tax=Confluentibacter sediminis TaxID=2219045 RepID=UPI0013A6978B|nr:SusC/RagA family TonB-linked outer membrane protein [Confluentibacter sediminis]
MRTFIFLMSTMLYALGTNSTLGQEIVFIKSSKERSVDEVFDIIKKQTKYHFIYDQDLTQKIPSVLIERGKISVIELVKKVIRNTNYDFLVSNDNTILIKEDGFSIAEQDKLISGTVVDQSGNPIPGVTIIIKGTRKGISSNFDGHYSVTVPYAASVLVFSYIGYRTQEVVVGKQTIINVILEEDIADLDEVMVIGYGTSTRRELTGSVERIGAEEIQQQVVASPLQSLQGRMTGVAITQSTGQLGTSINVQIRGINSIASGREPLYIVDGVPVTNESLAGLYYPSDYIATETIPQVTSNPLNSINPDDIQSIEVLKDASATAIYGSRGSNGVVLITTKQARAGESRLDVNYSTSMSSATRITEMLNTAQYVSLRQETMDFNNITPTASDYPDLTVWDQSVNRDWGKYNYGNTGLRQNVHARLTGGSVNTRYLLSAGYLAQGDITPGDSREKRLSTDMNIQHTSDNERLNIDMRVNYSYHNLDIHKNGNSMLLPPHYPLYEENGELYWRPDAQPNPVALLASTYKSDTYNMIGSVDLRYEVLKGLNLGGVVSYNRQQLKETELKPLSSVNPFSFNPQANSAFGQGGIQSVNIEPQVRYETDINKGRLEALLGATWNLRSQNRELLSFSGFTSEALLESWQGASSIDYVNNTSSEYHYQSIFARINYNWDDHYILDLSYRRDGSSRFGPDRKWGNFGAIGAAWLFSHEDFIREALPVLSFGKLRASYGVTGNDQIADYGYLGLYSSVSLAGLVDGKTSLLPTVLANNEYSWESTSKLEAGLELGFFSERLLVEATWFRSRTDDQLVANPLPIQTGFSSFQNNLPALVENRGWEFELQTTNINAHNFSWRTSFNISILKNELLKFPDLESSSYSKQYAIGEPLDRVVVFNLERIDSATGEAIYTDVNEDGIINENDRVFNVGRLSPRTFGGLGNMFRYKGLQLEVFIQFAQQLSTTWRNYLESPLLGQNLPVYVLGEYWTGPGDEDATLPNLSSENGNIASLDWHYPMRDSQLGVKDVFYARLKTVNLSWNFPVDLVSKIGLRDAQLTISGQNLLTYVNKELGKDPELNLWYNTPILKTWTMGLKLSF